MVLDTEPKKIGEESDMHTVERELNKCALELALLGNVDAARELVSILLLAGSVNGNWIISDGLTFAWHATGKYPEGHSDENAPKAHYETDRDNSWVGLPDIGKADDADALKACLDVEDDEHSNAWSGSSAMYKSQRLVRALEISLTLHTPSKLRPREDDGRAAKRVKTEKDEDTEQQNEKGRLKLTDLDEESAKILKDIVAHWGANQQVEYLGKAKRAWPLLARGVVADAFGMSEQDVQKKGLPLVNAFKARFKSGNVPSPFAKMGMRELLEAGNDNTIARMAEDGEMDEIPETLFRQPATEVEIEELEERLETVLPDDYKEFLRTTNGFGEGDEIGIWNGVFPDPALHEVSQVDWIEEEYFQLPVDFLDLPNEINDLVEGETRESRPNGELEFDGPFPLFDRVLEVGTADIYNLWLVHPQLVEKVRDVYHDIYNAADEKQKKVIVRAMEAFAGSKEEFEKLHWCFASWASGGSAHMTFYSSFRNFLERSVADSTENTYLGS